jgi:hypothetical protein
VVSVNGSNFLDVSEVLFNGLPASHSVESDSSLKVTVPAQASKGAITVKTAYATASSATPFTIVYPLTVNKTGQGIGSVTSTPAGITCGSDCVEEYAAGTAVTLTAQPETSSTFVGWSGSCTGNATTCVVTVDAAKSVTATFELGNFAVTAGKAGSGNGTITSTPAGINCGVDCTESYPFNTEVTLTAQAAAGSEFTGWSGACTTSSPTCSLTVTNNRAVTATFASNTFSLTVSKSGKGSGTVQSTPPGISCGSDCEEAYAAGAGVTLTAQPDAGSTFAGWGGACTGNQPVCTVTMNAAVSVIALFDEPQIFLPLIGK